MDQLTLYQGALRLCGERKLASLSENRPPRHLLDDVWGEDVIKTCLEQGPWQFATDTQRLDYDPDIEPDFSYRRGFPHPDGYVRTVGLSVNEFGDPPLTMYRDEGGVIYSDPDILYLSFVSNTDDFGRNLSLWPQTFSKFVMAVMAFEVNPRLTNSRAVTADIKQVMKERLNDALGKDGVNRPTTFPPRGLFVSARSGLYSTMRDDRRR